MKKDRDLMQGGAAQARLNLCQPPTTSSPTQYPEIAQEHHNSHAVLAELPAFGQTVRFRAAYSRFRIRGPEILRFI